MWNETPFARRLGIEYPIVQGPFGGGPSSVRLLSTVSNAGGLGSFGMQSLDSRKMIRTIDEIRASTDKPFAVNLWISRAGEFAHYGEDVLKTARECLEPYYRELEIESPPAPEHFIPDINEQFAAILEARPPVFSFVYGVPPVEVLAECQSRGILTIGTATTVDEARTLEQAGVDCIVASGFEAGGHKGSFLKPAQESLTGTLALIPQIADSVNIPVIAAGGIADARGIAAALALGAQGVQIGTAFLACDESNASTLHRAALFCEKAGSTRLTNAYTGRLARSIGNRFVEEMAAMDTDIPPYPIQSWAAGELGKAAMTQHRGDLISLSAGQAAALIHHHSASELFAELVRETPRLLKRLAGDS